MQHCHCEAQLREHLRKPQHAKEHAHRCVHACVVVLWIVCRRSTSSPDERGRFFVQDLEASLRSFVLGKCTKSKLNLVSTYLSNLLSDIEVQMSLSCRRILCMPRIDLDAVLVLERMKSSHDVLDDALEALEKEGARSASSKTKRMR